MAIECPPRGYEVGRMLRETPPGYVGARRVPTQEIQRSAWFDSGREEDPPRVSSFAPLVPAPSSEAAGGRTRAGTDDRGRMRNWRASRELGMTGSLRVDRSRDREHQALLLCARARFGPAVPQ